MFRNLVENFKEKSLAGRFLFVMSLLVLVAYFILGSVFIFWKAMPIYMDYFYRVAFGILIIVYAFIRFFRIFKLNNE